MYEGLSLNVYVKASRSLPVYVDCCRSAGRKHTGLPEHGLPQIDRKNDLHRSRSHHPDPQPDRNGRNGTSCSLFIPV